jgi:hypothetical protein
MRRSILVLSALMLLGSAAQAGRNVNGAMLVHTDNSVTYTSTADYCTSTIPPVCDDLNPNATLGIDREQVIWLVAMFRPESSPGVTTLQFGIRHNLPAGQGYFTDYGACGPGLLELPDSGWPESGFGNLVAYGVPVYSRAFPFYWFAVFVDGPENYFGTRTYPSTNEAKFVDDGNPPVEDLCYSFGTVRWDGTGANDCPCCPDEGACCFPDGTCQALNPDSCAALGGTFQGTGTVCDPNPCGPPVGSCCLCSGECVVVSEVDCAAQGGEYWNFQPNCDPNPCPAQIGVCCLPNGNCVEVYCIQQCTDQGGSFMGYGGSCTENPCAQPQEACCFADASCQFVTADECTLAGGNPQGYGTDCDPNDCPVTPTERTTWGRIKATYR